MKQKVINIIRHPLISGSLAMFVGTTLGSVLNFLFNLYMGNNLKVSDFGTLTSLVSVISLFLVVAGSAVPMVVNFAANYFAKNDLAHVRGLFIKVTSYYFFIGAFVLLLFIIFPQKIGTFFNISQIPLIYLSGFTIFMVFIGTINSALLQANLSFRYISLTNFIAALIKFAIGVLFLTIGWGVSGAMGAVVIAFVVPYFLSFYPLRFLFNKNLHAPHIKVKELFKYGVPAAIALFSVTSFISTDIILVKHFFSPDGAGIYSGLSLVGRVIFFLTAPIPTVMFPLIAQKHAKNESYNNTFFLALGIILLPSLAITLFYFLFPAFSIHIFFKKHEYLQGAQLLGLFGVYITVYSLLNVFTNFYLSIKKTKICIPIFISAVLQIVFIWFFHQTFLQIISISLTLTSILLVLFIIYYFRVTKSNLITSLVK